MDYKLCGRFDTLRNFLPDELNTTTELDFHNNGKIRNYCPDGGSGNTKECKTDFDKIKAGCLWLFEQFFVRNQKSDINIVEYIMMWLSYKLNQKTYDGIKNLNDFYTKYIENNMHYTNCDDNGKDCNESLKNNTGYRNYKEIIDNKNELLSINLGHMSKFYDAFKLLCKMYTEIGSSDTISNKSLNCAKEFVEKYDELNNPNNTKDNAYYQVLSTLSSDYKNFKKYCSNSNIDCSNIPPLPDIKTKENGVQISEPSSEVTPSSSSVTNKLIPVLSIIVAIPIFLGIFYKYSLFGFRKRPQKQHLRESFYVVGQGCVCEPHIWDRIMYYIVLIFYNLNTN
ncbi:PIR protein [Plasmodium yoelii yoelii]|uniref:PIR protein n=2 Tax=Plasmodium yoelii TaxID=5861 RepID=A0AAE9WMY5_PLAYO|nr:PIR protein [Plasmodium yoelii yoelii]